MRHKITRVFGTTCVAAMLAVPAAADEAEDLSAAFQADMDRIAAEYGVADRGATVTEHENGMQSTLAGLANMKMLMVRKNADGTLSFAHVKNAEESEEFANSDGDESATEEE